VAVVLRPLVLALFGLERLLARLLVRLGGPVSVHPFTGFGTDGWIQVGGRVLVGPPARSRSSRTSVVARSGRWAVVRANLLPFLTVEVPGAQVRLSFGGRHELVRADGDGYVHGLMREVLLTPGRHTVTLTPVDPAGPASRATVHVPEQGAGLAVVSDIDDTIVDSGVAHGLVAILTTMLLREQATRVPLAGAPELYQALWAPGRPFFYLSTSPWNLAGFLQGFLARHRFPDGPLILTDWGPGAGGLLRVSSRAHKGAALRRLAQQLPQTRFVLIGDTGQQDPEIYADFGREHPGRVAAVYVRRAGSPGPVADRRAEQATRLLAELGVPYLVTDDSSAMLAHARKHGLLSLR
jgi:phosphatidate phosphatase APP1